VIAGRPRQFEAPRLSMPLSATFGDAVRLLGLNMPAGQVQVRAGQPVTVSLAWQPLRSPAGDLSRFVHVLGPDRRPVAQRDGPPCEGNCPSPSWLPGEVLVDQVRVDIPSDLAPGVYSLAVGWYDAATRGRLSAVDASGTQAGDDLLALPVRIEVLPAEDGGTTR
jgi:hypothetical protein